MLLLLFRLEFPPLFVGLLPGLLPGLAVPVGVPRVPPGLGATGAVGRGDVGLAGAPPPVPPLACSSYSSVGDADAAATKDASITRELKRGPPIPMPDGSRRSPRGPPAN